MYFENIPLREYKNKPQTGRKYLPYIPLKGLASYFIKIDIIQAHMHRNIP